MSESDEEFEDIVRGINEGKVNFSPDEQDIIDSWLKKLLEPQESGKGKSVRNKYASDLAKLVIEDRQLSAPFNNMPPDADLGFSSSGGSKQFDFQVKKLGQCKPKSSQGIRFISKVKRTGRNLSPVSSFSTNEFEDPEEMAKAIALSKDQSFADFIVSISRHTADFGRELHKAMKIETNSFREYVDHVLTQRIKDLTEVLDEEQSRELQRIKKDINKWQMELAHVKRRIEEMIPGFDLDLYKKDKNYIKKLFIIKPAPSEDDSFKKWQEESLHRLKWISDRTCKITSCNEKAKQDISNIKCEIANLEAKEAMKQQSHITQINCEISQYQNLQSERDRLHRENNELLCQLEKLETKFKK